MKLKIKSPNKAEKLKIKFNFKSKYSGKYSAGECNNNILKTRKKNGNGDGSNKHSILDNWLIKIYSKRPNKQVETPVTTKLSNNIVTKTPELIVKLERLNIELINGEHIDQNHRSDTSGGINHDNNIHKKIKKCNEGSLNYKTTKKCPHCPFKTNSLSNFYFYKHVRSHVKQETEKCPVCKKNINWYSYKAHLKSHQKKREEMSYTKVEKNKYQCRKCDYVTNTSCNINLHYDAKHSDKIHKCIHCPFKTKMTYYFNNHVKGHEKKQTETCPYCKKDIKWFSYKTHLKTHERNDKTERKCDFCDYKSYNGANVKRHMLTHKDFDELEKFGCDLCGFIGITKDNLNNHKKLVHTKEGKWRKCDKCDYSTRRPSHLARHLLIHSRTSVQCTECFKYYTSEKNLEAHVKRAHSADVEKRYFYCELCPRDEQYKTTEKGNLKRHMLSHRTKKELEMFSCHKCSYLGKCKRALKEHFLTRHMPELHGFRCSACDYTTPYRSRFNLHHREVHEKKKIRTGRRGRNIEGMVKTDDPDTDIDEEQLTSGDEEVDTDSDNEPVGIAELQQFCSDVKQVDVIGKLSKCNDNSDDDNDDKFEFKSKVKLARILGTGKIKQLD